MDPPPPGEDTPEPSTPADPGVAPAPTDDPVTAAINALTAKLAVGGIDPEKYACAIRALKGDKL